MNVDGHEETLVARHPGNKNAVKFGVYSPRLIGERAEEIAGDLLDSLNLAPAQRLAVHEAARCIALLEAIDRDIQARGIVDRRGKERTVLELRLRYSARLERWLEKFSSAMEAQRRPQKPPEASHDDYVRELQRIALHDPTASTQDKLAALKALLKFDVIVKEAEPKVLQVGLLLPGEPGEVPDGFRVEVDDSE